MITNRLLIILTQLFDFKSLRRFCGGNPKKSGVQLFKSAQNECGNHGMFFLEEYLSSSP